MADEINLQYLIAGTPDSALAHWRANPPQWAQEHGYKLIDQSFNSLVYERRRTSGLMRTVDIFGFGETVYRVSIVFTAEGSAKTRVTVSGQADRKARAAIESEAATQALK